MTLFAWTFAAMLAAILIERAVLWRSGAALAPWRDMVANLNSGHLVMWVLRGVEVAGYAWVLENLNLNAVGAWPLWLQWVFGFLAWDFCFYWMHRAHHRFGFLWAVHGIHHLGEHFNLSLGVRNSWYSSLSNFPFIVGLAVLGLPLELFIAVSSLHYGVQFYNHNGVVKQSGFLDKLLVTPSNHRVHHGMHPSYIDKNFGGTLLVWDKLFGTYQAERADLPMQFGVAGERGSENPWVLNHAGFFKQNTHRSAASAVPAAFKPSDAYIGAGGIALFLAVIAWVGLPSQSLSTIFTAAHAGYWLFAALIVAGSVVLASISVGHGWALLAWFALGAGLSTAFFTLLPSTLAAAMSLMLIAHSAWGIYLFFSPRSPHTPSA